MAVLIDTTPASPFANSFEDVAGADAYFASQLYAAAWFAATTDEKAQALITTTRALSRMNWDGWPWTRTQALPFPRSGLLEKNGIYPLANTIIPAELKAATAEGARQLLESGQLPSTPLETVGLKRIKAGSVELEYEPGGVPAMPWITDLALDYIAQWLIGPRRGSIVVPLVRS